MTDEIRDAFGLVGSRLDGKYAVEAVVAEGGFGVVYRGTHVALQKSVAIKVLKVPDELAGPGRKSFLERFAQEARLIAALDHPAIVRVIDFGASPMPVGEAAPWMVLDWLTGLSLEQDLDARRGAGGRLPVECLHLLRPVLEAIAAAHDDGIVHRDIKPSNIMRAIDRRGRETLRVLDFGIAKVMGSEGEVSSGLTATQTQQRAFSLLYATPEQISGMRTGPWTDVYALALVLTEMLTDLGAYDGEDAADIYAEVLSATRPTPAKRGFDVGAWEAVIAKAVSLKPSDRHASVREFLAALEADVPAAVIVGGAAAIPARRSGNAPLDTLERAQTERSVPVATAPRRRVIAIALAAAGLVVLSAGLVRYRRDEGPAATARSALAPAATTLTAQSLPPAPVAPGAAARSAPLAIPDAGREEPGVADPRVLPRVRTLAVPRASRPLPIVRTTETTTQPTPLPTTPRRPTGHEILTAE
jgi:serine/threonine protein kinase